MLCMKRNVNLRQIEAFHTVMHTGTVSGAAQMMSITQPAVSRAIALLELRIGFKLFERKGRRLVATPEADALFREVAPIYGSLDKIAQLADDIRNQRAGALRVATLPALSIGEVPRALAKFLSSRPEVTAFVQSLPTRQIAEMVATKQFDVAVVELPLSLPSISIEPLEPVPLVAVIPATHRLANKRRISLKELGGERMILLSKHSYVRYQIEDAFSKLNVAPDVVIETPTSLIACSLVEAGAGITLATGSVAATFAGPDVIVRPIIEDITSRCAIIYPYPGKPLALAEAFADEFRAEFERSRG